MSHLIRGQLEVEQYDSPKLIDNFAAAHVISLPFFTFIDGFRLYRNMHRSLTGFYRINAALSYNERARRTNVLPSTLGPHDCNLVEVT